MKKIELIRDMLNKAAEACLDNGYDLTGDGLLGLSRELDEEILASVLSSNKED